MLQAALEQVEQAEKTLAQHSSGGTRLEQLKQVSPQLISWKLIQKQRIKTKQKLDKIIQEKLIADNTYQLVTLKLEQTEAALQKALNALESEATNNLAIQKNHAAALQLTK